MPNVFPNGGLLNGGEETPLTADLYPCNIVGKSACRNAVFSNGDRGLIAAIAFGLRKGTVRLVRQRYQTGFEVVSLPFAIQAKREDLLYCTSFIDAPRYLIAFSAYLDVFARVQLRRG